MKIVADLEIPYIEDYFSDEGELVLKPGRSLRSEDVKDADLLIIRSVTPVNETLLKGSSVKWVGTVTTGLDHLDLAWLKAAGISWASAAGYNAEPVSDYLIAVLAALGQEALPKTAGLIGVGRVGSKVAKRLEALGLKLFLNDPPRAAAEASFSSSPLSSLAAADLVSLHLPLTIGGEYPSFHLLAEDFLAASSQPKLLINTSRGALLDSSVLKQQKEHWHYCLDVWEGEPLLDLELLEAATIATPHLAGYSVQCRYRGIALIHQAVVEAGFIQAKARTALTIPAQTLRFGGRAVSWQEAVLKVFNPLEVTEVMKETLLKEPAKCATLFDRLRKAYIGDSIERHEFASTSLEDLQLAASDRSILKHLGFIIKE